MPYKVVKQSGITRIALRYNKPFITTDTDILDIIADKVCDTDFIITTDPMEISKAINTFFSDNPEDKIKAKMGISSKYFSKYFILGKNDHSHRRIIQIK